MNDIKLSDHFDYKRLLRYCLPSIVMMLFTSIYCIVDGFFVSNFAGKTPFAAVNLIMPLLLVLGCVGFMFGTGGGALIAKIMGCLNSQVTALAYVLKAYVDKQSEAAAE